MAEHQYITRLVSLKCSMGTMTNPLNVKMDHGVIWEQESDKFPIMNANDHISGENVIHFGRCQSDKNPHNFFDIENALMFVFCPASVLIRKLSGCNGCKCEPKIVSPWVNTSMRHMVEGAPALTSESKLACYYGGIITITYETEEVKSE